MLLHNAAADRQPKSGATPQTRIRGVDLLEPLEDALQLVWRNAAPTVGDAEAHSLTVAARSQMHRSIFG